MKIFRILLALCLFVGAHNSMASQPPMTDEQRMEALSERAFGILGEFVGKTTALRTALDAESANKAMQAVALLQQRGMQLTPEQKGLVARAGGILKKETEKSTVSTAVKTRTTGRVLGGRRTTPTATTGTAAARKVVADDEIRAFINSSFNTNLIVLSHVESEEEFNQKLERIFIALKTMQPASNISNDYLMSLIQEALNMNDQVSNNAKVAVWTQINKLFSEDIEKSKVKPTVKPSIITPTSRRTGRVLGGRGTTTLPRPVATEPRRETMPTTTPAVRTTTPAVGTTMTGKARITGRVLGGRRVAGAIGGAARPTGASVAKTQIQEFIDSSFNKQLSRFSVSGELSQNLATTVFDELKKMQPASGFTDDELVGLIASSLEKNTNPFVSSKMKGDLYIAFKDAIFSGNNPIVVPIVKSAVTGAKVSQVGGATLLSEEEEWSKLMAEEQKEKEQELKARIERVFKNNDLTRFFEGSEINEIVLNDYLNPIRIIQKQAAIPNDGLTFQIQYAINQNKTGSISDAAKLKLIKMIDMYFSMLDEV